MSRRQDSPTDIPVWLVTGTSNGLGLALATYILSQGHYLVSTSRHSEPHELLQSHANASLLSHVQLDLASVNPELVKSTITDKVLPIHDRVDVLVNMAAMTHFGPLETLSTETLQTVFQTNCFTPLYIIQALLPHFRSHVGANKVVPKTVINVSSTQGLCSDPSETAYDASKHAFEAMSEVLSLETHNRLCNNVRTLIIEPGAFRTNLVGGSNMASGSKREGSDSQKSDHGLTSPYSEPDHPVRKRMDMVAQYGAGKARGDPKKAAKVIFDAVVGKDEVGAMVSAWDQSEEGKKGEAQRIVLGPDAWAKIDKKMADVKRNVDAGKAIAQSTDFDDWNTTGK